MQPESLIKYLVIALQVFDIHHIVSDGSTTLDGYTYDFKQLVQPSPSVKKVGTWLENLGPKKFGATFCNTLLFCVRIFTLKWVG